MRGNIETEIKIKLFRSIEEIEKKLLKLDFKKISGFLEEINFFYDREWELKEKNFALRLRSYGDKNFLTLKGKSFEKKIKVRYESEVIVSSFYDMDEILNRLGYKKFFEYKKLRELFENYSGVLIAIDKTPFGNFIEIEGDKKSIKYLMKVLNLSDKDVVEKNYLELFMEHSGKSI